MNHVILRGRLGREPQLKDAADGKPYARLRLAVNGGDTVWITVLAFGDMLERVVDLKKGQIITVWGRLARSKKGDILVIARALEIQKSTERAKPDQDPALEELPF